MTFNEILSNINKGIFHPVYILMGEEPYFIDKLAEALEEKVIPDEDRDFNLNVMYGADVQCENVITAAQRFPVMAPAQMVMLKESQSMHSAKAELEKIAGYLNNPTRTTVLVIIYKGESLGATHGLIKAATKNSKDVVLFKSPKIRDYQLPDLLSRYCKTNRIPIDQNAINMLCEFIGTNLTNLFSEIEKLRISNGPENMITPEVIERNIGYSKDFNNFELTSALINRDYTKAVRIVKYFRDNPKNNPTPVTTGTLFAFFQKVVIANFLTDKSDTSLKSVLGIKNSFGMRDMRQAMRVFNPAQSIRAISLIREFDTKSKGIGSMQKDYDLLLELVFKLSTL